MDQTFFRRSLVLFVGIVISLTLAGVLATQDRPEAKTVAASPDGSATEQALLHLGKATLPETRKVDDIAPGVTYTRIDRGNPLTQPDQIATSATGPWTVHVLRIDPKVAMGRLESTHGPSLERPETTSVLAKYAGALVAVNAAYFPHSDDSIPPSDPGGLAIRAGQILSEPSPRAREDDLIYDAATGWMRIAKTRWSGTFTMANGRSLAVGMVNHPPALPTGCARLQEQRACTQLGEVARFSIAYAQMTPSGPGVEVVFDQRDCVRAVHQRRGVALARGETSIQATGIQVRTLLALGTGCGSFRQMLVDSDGQHLKVGRDTYAVNGRGVLVKDGAAVAGLALDDAFHGRNPRTMVGQDADGRWVMATIEGRSVTSVGTTMRETTSVALDLGLVDALNLDGGGSSAMVVRDRLVNHVAGGTSQRLVSNALVWIPEEGH